MPASLHEDIQAYMQQHGLPNNTKTLNEVSLLFTQDPSQRPSYNAAPTATPPIDVVGTNINSTLGIDAPSGEQARPPLNSEVPPSVTSAPLDGPPQSDVMSSIDKQLAAIQGGSGEADVPGVSGSSIDGNAGVGSAPGATTASPDSMPPALMEAANSLLTQMNESVGEKGTMDTIKALLVAIGVPLSIAATVFASRRLKPSSGLIVRDNAATPTIGPSGPTNADAIAEAQATRATVKPQIDAAIEGGAKDAAIAEAKTQRAATLPKIGAAQDAALASGNAPNRTFAEGDVPPAPYQRPPNKLPKGESAPPDLALYRAQQARLRAKGKSTERVKRGNR